MNNEFDYKALGERIRKARKEKHLTQEHLAELCDLSTAHIGHIERGTRTLSIESLITISSVLNVSIDYLLLNISNKQKNNVTSIINAVNTADKDKYDRFYSVVKILAERIDDL
ncbi:MAG: helix-turn-helix transcriptional regulator [Clostridia bacterium]|nr:helix-turn-helix transcriptional regulator [Clostridia bacterium]